MKVTVKRWLADQKAMDMKKYHLMPEYEYTNHYYVDENGNVTMRVREVVKETEKAICLALETETEGFRGHEPFNMWFPKSQVIALA